MTQAGLEIKEIVERDDWACHWGDKAMREVFPLRKSGDGIAYIDGAEAAHLSRVLRMGPGIAWFWQTRAWSMRGGVDSCRQRGGSGQDGRREPAQGAEGAFTLCAAYMKADKMELIAQKATERGVSRFQPFFSSRCVKQPAGKLRKRRWSAWREFPGRR